MGNIFRGIIDADSKNTLAGNVLRKSEKPVELAAALGNGEGSKDGAANQSAIRYGNSLLGTSVSDTLAGDVLAVAAGNISIRVLVGKGGEAYAYDTPVKPGKGGDGNRLFAFNDSESGNGGEDVVAGDIYSTEKGSIGLTVDVGGGASAYGLLVADAGGSGSGNDAMAFNDRLLGGNGNDFSAVTCIARPRSAPSALLPARVPAATAGGVRTLPTAATRTARTASMTR